MDAFETFTNQMKQMSPADQAAWTEENGKLCICPGCPTHTTCAKNNKELLFCTMGKSFMCISAEKGCLCPTCPVHANTGMKHKSYCTRGAEKAQRYEHTIWGTKIP
jgi:hypothetical protein